MDLAATHLLIRRALDGGRPERGLLMEHLRPRLVLWAGSRLSAAMRAKLEPEDIAQEALLAVHQAIADFRGRDERAFMAWMFRIAENRIRDLVDYHNAEKRRPPRQPLSFTQTSPSTAAARKEEVARILDALPGLSDDYREVLRLRRFEERDVKEVAGLMGRSENAVRVLYCRALKALRAAMEKP